MRKGRWTCNQERAVRRLNRSVLMLRPKYIDIKVDIRVSKKPQQEQLIRTRIDSVSLDSTIIKVHPDGTGVP
jgi:hypothetical protein